MDHLAVLGDLQSEFLETTRRADPDVRIPWLGRWTVRSLVVHLSRIHHWAAAQARREQETPLGRGPFDLPVLYEECARELRETLAELDPGARAWTLLDDGVPRSEQVGTVAFWHGRQVLETLVHLWDLRTAIGERLEVDDVLWLDCLDEAVTVMHPRQVRLGRVTAPTARVSFASAGTDAMLEVRGAPADATEAVVAGPVEALALIVWGRLGLDADGVEVRGDRGAAEALLAAGLTP
ncbi:maleylpyruvate isomerase family mycothiol-dependent enzyme [Agrococcus sp. DT81.2]|uniref:maleylpyruvate isomerase family mycothiol-dependent enzyme n=1 Tax=Agrococcus sp. DT81.2 TaxID=3393414 RepID=UPI003CE4C306